MERLETLNSLIVFAILLQPLGVVSPVLAETVRMEYSDPDHIHAPKVVDGVEYQYDANGNLVNDGDRAISWNQDNLPTRIEKDGQVVEFFYDADGRRIVKKSGQNETVYVNQYYEQLTINNQQSSTKYYFANGKRVAAKLASPTSEAEHVLQLHSDHLGSTVLATDSNSQVLGESLSYFPYGSSMNNEQLTMSNYLFTGQEKDPESDLYNYHARLYNPTTGSFISADILEPERGNARGLNRYGYVEGNPVRLTDPVGLQVSGVAEPPAAESDLGGFLALANFLKERFPKGLTLKLWTPEIRSEVEEDFGVGAAWAIEDSLVQTGSLQCVGLARAYTMLVNPQKPLPPLGGGPKKVGIAFENFRWHEDMTEVEVGDIFFYQVQKPNGFYNHWAIVSEKTPSGIKLVEAVGAGFRSLGKAPGAILVNERTFDFGSGQITGLVNPLEEGFYGFYRPEQ